MFLACEMLFVVRYANEPVYYNYVYMLERNASDLVITVATLSDQMHCVKRSHF